MTAKQIPATPAPGMFTTRDVADHFKVKVGTVQNWVVDGCPANRRGKGKPVLFDIDKVKAWRSDSSSAGANLDPQREKALLDRERRLKVTTERRVLEGKLIPVSEVEEHWGRLVMSARAKLLSLPNKLAPAVVSCGTLIEVEDEARRLIAEALSELAGTGLPDEVFMDAAARSDSESVGGQVSEAESGGIGGAGAVADEPGPVPTGDS